MITVSSIKPHQVLLGSHFVDKKQTILETRDYYLVSGLDNNLITVINLKSSLGLSDKSQVVLITCGYCPVGDLDNNFITVTNIKSSSDTYLLRTTFNHIQILATSGYWIVLDLSGNFIIVINIKPQLDSGIQGLKCFMILVTCGCSQVCGLGNNFTTGEYL